MPKFPDAELQARIIQEILDVIARKRKLEDDIRTADEQSKLLIDSAARRDIEAYKRRHLCIYHTDAPSERVADETKQLLLSGKLRNVS